MGRLNLPLPPRLSSVPAIDRDALAWAALFKDQLEHLLNGPVGTAVCSAALTLAVAAADVVGATVTLPAGTYLVHGVFDFFHSVNGGGVAIGTLVVGGTPQLPQALLLNSGAANGDRATVTQVWLITVAGNTIVKLQGAKTVAAGTVQALNQHTTLTYQRVS